MLAGGERLLSSDLAFLGAEQKLLFREPVWIMVCPIEETEANENAVWKGKSQEPANKDAYTSVIIEKVEVPVEIGPKRAIVNGNCA